MLSIWIYKYGYREDFFWFSRKNLFLTILITNIYVLRKKFFLCKKNFFSYYLDIVKWISRFLLFKNKKTLFEYTHMGIVIFFCEKKNTIWRYLYKFEFSNIDMLWNKFFFFLQKKTYYLNFLVYISR